MDRRILSYYVEKFSMDWAGCIIYLLLWLCGGLTKLYKDWRSDMKIELRIWRIDIYIILYQAQKVRVIKTSTRVIKRKIVPVDKKNYQFGNNSSSLPLRPTEFVSEERHITDMSSNRKKIVEPWEIVRETCGRGTKIAMFACFCPSKKPLFSLFLQILPFPAKI